MNKLNLLNQKEENKVNLVEIDKAIYYAKKYHGTQMRQSGEPFYSHPLEVAYMISDYLFRTDIIITSILHDTIEDTELTKEKIAEEFGWKIANQVQDLTRIKEDGIKISSAEMVELLYMEKKHAVLLIKLFDRLHNMQTISTKSPEKIKKIVEETLKSFISLSIYLRPRISKTFQLEDMLNDLCYKSICPKGQLPKKQITCFSYEYHLPAPRELLK